MQHLDTGRLAAFDHEPFSDDERAHLASCAVCRAERDAHVQLVTLAAGVREADAHTDARLLPWERIADGLRREGYPTVHGEAEAAFASAITQTPVGGDIGDGPMRGAAPAMRSFGARWMAPARRLAAAVALVVGGAWLGRVAPGAGVAVATSDSSATLMPAVARGDAGFGSIDEATGALSRAQREYERASLWLAANDTAARDSEVYRARLAALDQMMAASRAALRDAPQDPILNHYYLAAYNAREATLQQLVSTLPADKVIERY
ncbi:MAG: hypothetical protein LCH84_00150 [Gemmatimonadetes bacterium]|nr:hypothetical protein [Gemmatimonadota bacterium]